jgi:dTDP-4-amino-4,6-dideoxy-D-galactose acyltransferase
MDYDELDPCQVLDWDSAFFGFRIAQLREVHLTAQSVFDSLKWCDREGIRCLYFLASGDSLEAANLAGANGSRMVDIRFTLAREPGGGQVGEAESVRAFDEADLSALRSIARVSHRDSRFYSDPGFPDQRCDELYETWIDRSCHGFADRVLVAEHLLKTAGYVSCHLRPNGIGAIGLLAVADGFRGVGLGRRLVAGALHFFAEAGCKSVTVVTQGRNIAAQRLYQNCGFRSASMELWYHRWFEQVIS